MHAILMKSNKCQYENRNGTEKYSIVENEQLDTERSNSIHGGYENDLNQRNGKQSLREAKKNSENGRGKDGKVRNGKIVLRTRSIG